MQFQAECGQEGLVAMVGDVSVVTVTSGCWAVHGTAVTTETQLLSHGKFVIEVLSVDLKNTSKQKKTTPKNHPKSQKNTIPTNQNRAKTPPLLLLLVQPWRTRQEVPIYCTVSMVNHS